MANQVEAAAAAGVMSQRGVDQIRQVPATHQGEIKGKWGSGSRAAREKTKKRRKLS